MVSLSEIYREERIADRHLDKITINYFDKLVQITCDEALKNYLEEPGNGAVELSAHILKEHTGKRSCRAQRPYTERT